MLKLCVSLDVKATKRRGERQKNPRQKHCSPYLFAFCAAYVAESGFRAELSAALF
ncbi:MAG: hypothetical protein LBU73_00520 [Helicobacteraceae bacterium]|nr:hypothetical protein [Helicobacteraceae bacterium]